MSRWICVINMCTGCLLYVPRRSQWTHQCLWLAESYKHVHVHVHYEAGFTAPEWQTWGNAVYTTRNVSIQTFKVIKWIPICRNINRVFIKITTRLIDFILKSVFNLISDMYLFYYSNIIWDKLCRRHHKHCYQINLICCNLLLWPDHLIKLIYS